MDCACVYLKKKIRIIGGTLSDSNDSFPSHDWEYSLERKTTKKIQGITHGRINFGICTIDSDYILLAGGKNSKNEQV